MSSDQEGFESDDSYICGDERTSSPSPPTPRSFYLDPLNSDDIVFNHSDDKSESDLSSTDESDIFSTKEVYTPPALANAINLLRDITTATEKEIAACATGPGQELRDRPYQHTHADPEELAEIIHNHHHREEFFHEIQREVTIAVQERDNAFIRLHAAHLELFKLRQDLITIGEGIGLADVSDPRFPAAMKDIGYKLVEAGKYGSESRERRERKRRRLNRSPQEPVIPYRDLV